MGRKNFRPFFIASSSPDGVFNPVHDICIKVQTTNKYKIRKWHHQCFYTNVSVRGANITCSVHFFNILFRSSQNIRRKSCELGPFPILTRTGGNETSIFYFQFSIRTVLNFVIAFSCCSKMSCLMASGFFIPLMTNSSTSPAVWIFRFPNDRNVASIPKTSTETS